MYIKDDDLIELRDDPTPVFKECHQLFVNAKSRMKMQFENRENFIDAEFYERYPDSDLLHPSVVERQLDRMVYNRFYFQLRDVLTDRDDEDDGDEEDDTEYNPNVLFFTIVDGGEFVDGVEHISERVFRISDAFSVELPVPKSMLDECEVAYFGIEYEEDGGFDTSFGFVSDDAESEESEDEELIEYLFKTTPSREQREAFAIYQDSYECVLVAMGQRAISACSYPNRYTDMKRFPVDSFVWSSEESEEETEGDGEDDTDEENEDDSESTEYQFIYNTDLITESEIQRRIDDFSSAARPVDSAARFGELLGYPQYAVDYFADMLEENIPPAYQNDVTYYYRLLSGELSSDDLNTLDYVSYIPPRTTDGLTEALSDGRRKRDTVYEFVEMYDLPVEHSLTEYTDVQSLPTEFDQIWTIEELDPRFEIE